MALSIYIEKTTAQCPATLLLWQFGLILGLAHQARAGLGCLHERRCSPHADVDGTVIAAEQRGCHPGRVLKTLYSKNPAE